MLKIGKRAFVVVVGPKFSKKTCYLLEQSVMGGYIWTGKLSHGDFFLKIT